MLHVDWHLGGVELSRSDKAECPGKIRDLGLGRVSVTLLRG